MSLQTAILLTGAALAALPVPAAAQAAAEYGLGSALSGAMGAAAKSTGKAIESLNRKIGQTLEGAAQEKAAPARASAKKSAKAASQAAEPALPPKPPVVYEDPAGIKAGMERDEVIRRFGPTTAITTGAGRELLIYTGKDRNFDVQLVDGKVATVESPGPPSASR